MRYQWIGLGLSMLLFVGCDDLLSDTTTTPEISEPETTIPAEPGDDDQSDSTTVVSNDPKDPSPNDPKDPSPNDPKDPSPNDPKTCNKQLKLQGNIATNNAGCVLDENVSYVPGVLTYPCAGGSASATFANHVFVGTVSKDGQVDLKLSSDFDFDGCKWQSVQTIKGTLKSAKLDYKYEEVLLDTKKSYCVESAGACSGKGTLQVK